MSAKPRPSAPPASHARFGLGVEYALHCLLYLLSPPDNRPLGIKELAAFQGVSEAYLAKVFLRLKRAGLVTSTGGRAGGYLLAKPPHAISFWDVVIAVEGDVPLFRCQQIRANCALFDRNGGPLKTPATALRGTCGIHAAFLEAERALRASLQKHTLASLANSLKNILTHDQFAQTSDWFRKALEHRN